MNAPIYILPPPPVPAPEPSSQGEVAHLLRQLVGLHQEQLGVLKAQAAGQDAGARWRAFLARWADDFPDLGAACRQALPPLERAYLQLVRELTDRVAAAGGDLDDEFLLGEFLDRFGMRLGQLGNILSQLAPLADAAPLEEKG